MKQETCLLYIASSSDTQHGIYLVRLNLITGQLTLIEKQSTGSSIQFLTQHPSQPVLYATGPSKNGNVYAYQVDYSTGNLTLINQQSCVDNAPCYASVDPSGQFVLVSNYSGDDGCGSVCVFPVDEQGGLGVLSDYIRHSGNSIHPQKQRCSHPHSVLPVADTSYVLVQDLGLDTIFAYELDAQSGKLDLRKRITVSSGSGPRHLTVNPACNQMYLLNELNATIIVFDTDWDTLTIRQSQTISTLPKHYERELKSYPHNPETGGFRRPTPEDNDHVIYKPINRTADIHITSDSLFLYASNRGHNSLAIYRVAGDTGQLTAVGHQSSLGDWCRGFAITPDDRILIVGNQWSDNVFTFFINDSTGQLTPTGHQLSLPSPISIVSPTSICSVFNLPDQLDNAIND